MSKDEQNQYWNGAREAMNAILEQAEIDHPELMKEFRCVVNGVRWDWLGEDDDIDDGVNYG